MKGGEKANEQGLGGTIDPQPTRTSMTYSTAGPQLTACTRRLRFCFFPCFGVTSAGLSADAGAFEQDDDGSSTSTRKLATSELSREALDAK